MMEKVFSIYKLFSAFFVFTERTKHTLSSMTEKKNTSKTWTMSDVLKSESSIAFISYKKKHLIVYISRAKPNQIIKTIVHRKMVFE